MTGHLVFSTVHTNDAPSTITRMIDQGIEPYLVSSSLVLVIAQRLVRTVCKSCRTLEAVTHEWIVKLEKLGMTSEDVGGEIAFGAGCDDCFHSGYSGRTAIYEFLPIGEEIRTMVMEGATASQMKRWAVANGMRTLRSDGIEKIKQRMTTPDEILRVTQLD